MACPRSANHPYPRLFMLDNVKMLDVTGWAYYAAAELEDDLRLEPNDALAVDVMMRKNIKEIHSFNENFDHVKGISRPPRL